MLVDSSVWIDYLRDLHTPETDRLEEELDRQSLLVGDLVLTEVLQGCTTDRAFAIAHHELTALPIIPIAGSEVAIAAARHYRHLRSLGITVRKTIDTLIATRCILDGHALLFSDRDFDPFVAHCGLRDAMAG